jgi:bacillithiol biosynthesis cysteine-adding enzyme BshC
LRDLLADYQVRRPELMQFYAAAPELALNGAPKPRWDPALVDAVNAYQAHLGAKGRVAGNETVIVTGQQPGLFTGPLYTIYKALTAIHLARSVQERTGTPCLPLFWIAADDHDFAETGHVHILTKFHEPLALRYTPSADIAGMPMHQVPLEPSLHTLIDTAADAVVASECAADVRAFLHASLDASQSYADWTARLLARLFANTPLVLFAPHLPVARALARPAVEAAIRAPSMVTDVLRDTGVQLQAQGYPQQVEKRADECAFFLELERRRRKVTFRDGRFVLPETRQAFTQDELLSMLETTPGNFSPNVALRCAVQQQLFPAAAYVAGPGELAYWAQLKPLFTALNLRPPAVYPRARCVITNEKTRRLLDELGFSLADAQRSVEELTTDALRHTADSPALDVVRAERAGLEELAQRLAADLSHLHAPAGDMANKLHRSLCTRLDHLEWVIARGDDERRKAVRDRVTRITNWVAPWRKPQERVYSIVSFLFDQGWPFIDRLDDALDVETQTLQEVQL